MLNFICVHVSALRFVNSAAEIMLSCPPYVLRYQQITAVHAWPSQHHNNNRWPIPVLVHTHTCIESAPSKESLRYCFENIDVFVFGVFLAEHNE